MERVVCVAAHFVQRLANIAWHGKARCLIPRFSFRWPPRILQLHGAWRGSWFSAPDCNRSSFVHLRPQHSLGMQSRFCQTTQDPTRRCCSLASNNVCRRYNWAARARVTSCLPSRSTNRHNRWSCSRQLSSSLLARWSEPCGQLHDTPAKPSLQVSAPSCHTGKFLEAT